MIKTQNCYVRKRELVIKVLNFIYYLNYGHLGCYSKNMFPEYGRLDVV